jgi:hypothetical protein
MVSDSSKTYTKRCRKRASGGKARKKALERDGSTPKFPIHPEGSKPAKKKPA